MMNHRIKPPFSDSNAVSETSSVYDSPRGSHYRYPPSGRNSALRSPVHQFKSYRLIGDYQQPWKSDKRLRRTRIGNCIIYGFVVAGLLLSGFICYRYIENVPRGDFCLILDENFDSIDSSVWNHEVQIDGFGTGSFDWTTTDSANSYVDTDGLHIIPTLTNETTSITTLDISNGYTLNLTTDGTCTSNSTYSCSIRSNSTTGMTVPPVRSARLNTRGKKMITYGKIEVVAKMPKGDWLWPAIWMMPENSVYGEWPRSGEIDIVESRGNDVYYPSGGRDQIDSTLHWGPASVLDAFWRTTNALSLRRTDYTESYHKFGMQWSKDYLFTWRDSPLQQILYVDFNDNPDFWQRGKFEGEEVNNTVVTDPWTQTGRKATPFDQAFYLILNVAVGGTNGWFKDGEASKPWVDASGHYAPGDFWQAVDEWLPTWGAGNDRGMTVKSVKMWQEGLCGAT